MAIALKGKIIFSGGVGCAELDNFTPTTGRTVHNIASISKTHAAVAVMQLVEQGKVTLDDPIQKYVPYFPKKKWEITVRHIWAHTSGIRHYRNDDFGEQRHKEKIHYDSLKTAIEIFKYETKMDCWSIFLMLMSVTNMQVVALSPVLKTWSDLAWHSISVNY